MHKASQHHYRWPDIKQFHFLRKHDNGFFVYINKLDISRIEEQLRNELKQAENSMARNTDPFSFNILLYIGQRHNRGLPPATTVFRGAFLVKVWAYFFDRTLTTPTKVSYFLSIKLFVKHRGVN